MYLQLYSKKNYGAGGVRWVGLCYGTRLDNLLDAIIAILENKND